MLNFQAVDLNGFYVYRENYILVTLLIVLLTPLDILDKGVLLIMSGRQGAGGFSVTCNVIKDDTSCFKGNKQF